MRIDTSKLPHPKKKRKILPTIPKLRDRAFKYFSIYVRLSEADKNGYVRCVTCGKARHYKEMQAGHFKHGKNKECYFDKRNVHPQDVNCNYYHKTVAMQRYAVFMIRKYGQKVVEELLNSKTVIWRREILEDIIETYKKKVKELV